MFGWDYEKEPLGEWLLPCEMCKSLEDHEAYFVHLSLAIFFIPVPLRHGRYVKCTRCGRETEIARDEEEHLEKTSAVLSGLARLRELNPQAAERIAWEIDWERDSMADWRQRIARALEDELTVEKVEERLRREGRLPPRGCE